MSTSLRLFSLDPFSQTVVDLWRAASLRLAAGPESNDVFVQAAGHAVVAWLKQEAATPRALLDMFGRPGGSLLPQLHLVGSLVHDPAQALPSEPPRLWWWVVAAAYYHQWLELSSAQLPKGQPPEAAL
jgi:hypothetical protein